MNTGISARLASWPAALDASAAGERIRSELHAAARIAPMVLELRDGGGLCGWISLCRVPDKPDTGILTYWLGAAYHGQGLMREAAVAAVAGAFESSDLKRIKAAVQTDNLASIAVLEGLGMALAGPGRIWCAARNREEDCLWFAMERPVLRMPAMDLSPEPATLLPMAIVPRDAIGHSEAVAGVPER